MPKIMLPRLLSICTFSCQITLFFVSNFDLARLLPLLPLDYSTIQLFNPAAPSRQAGSALRSDQTQKSLNSPSPMEITSSGLTSPPRRISDFFSGTVTSFSLALFTGSAMALWTSAPTLVPPAIYFLLTAYCLLSFSFSTINSRPLEPITLTFSPCSAISVLVAFQYSP